MISYKLGMQWLRFGHLKLMTLHIMISKKKNFE